MFDIRMIPARVTLLACAIAAAALPVRAASASILLPLACWNQLGEVWCGLDAGLGERAK